MALRHVSLPPVDADDLAPWSAPPHESLVHVADVLQRLYDACQPHGWLGAQEALMVIEQLIEHPLWVDVTEAPPFTLQAIDVLMRLHLVRGFRDHDDPRHPRFNKHMYVLTASDGHAFAAHLYPILGHVTTQLPHLLPSYSSYCVQRLIANRVLEYVDRYVFPMNDFVAPPVSEIRKERRRAARGLMLFDVFGKDDHEEPVN